MNILLSGNKEFIKYAKTLIFSIYKNNKDEKLTFYFLYVDIDEKTLNSFKRFVSKKCKSEIIFYKVDEKKFEGLPTTNKDKTSYFGVEAYLRLLSQYVLPKKLDRILYIDIDTICNNSLKELYYMDFEGSFYCGVVEEEISPEYKKERNINEDRDYINSGVLLINLKELRKKVKREDIFDFIIKNKDIYDYPDQDVINMFYGDKIKYIKDYRFNNIIFYKRKFSKDIVIFHYAGSNNKPWQIKALYYLPIKDIIVYIKYEFLEGRVFEAFGKIMLCFFFKLIKNVIPSKLKRMIKKNK